MNKTIREIKDELHEMFPQYKGFIEHTLVATMCNQYHLKQGQLLHIDSVSKFDMQKFKEYVQTYNANKDGLDNNETIVKDMLYGIGLCLNKKEFKYADGFKKFKVFLKAFL